MDIKWFKSRQNLVGVTAEEIAARMGRDRTAVSRIYSGRQRMTLDWAKAFAEVLQVPLAEILERAGIADPRTAAQLAPGFSESDVAPWKAAHEADPAKAIAQALGADQPGIDTWEIKSTSMSLQGYLPGDMILLDSHQSERCRAGDIVIAQIYDHANGTARTVLRRLEPPVLVAAGPDPDDRRVHVVDAQNVVIMGKVIASWRS